MSDFLSSLALSASRSSSVGGPEVVRPRLASRFEPASGAAGAGFASWDGEVGEDTPTFDFAEGRRGTWREPRFADRLPVEGKHGTADTLPAAHYTEWQRTGMIAPANDSVFARLNSLEEHLREWGVSQPDKVRPIAIEHIAGDAEIASLSSGPNAATPPTEQYRDTVAPHVPRLVSTIGSDMLPLGPSEHVTNTDSHLDSTMVTSHSFDGDTRVVPVQPAVLPLNQLQPIPPSNLWATNVPPTATRPAVPSARQSPVEARVLPKSHVPAVTVRETKLAVSTPAPTIHVSIGRIEIRATTSPAAAMHRPAVPEKSPLDEYLRQRAGTRGGGR